MKTAGLFSLVALACVGLAFVSNRGAQARTPTPTATRTATASATAPPTATPQPTPCPPDTPTADPAQVAQFSGEVWLYVPGPYPPGGVTAKIGDTVCSIPAYVPPTCGQPLSVSPPSDPGPITGSYAIDVLPASVKPNCGYEGAQVMFFVGDARATNTATWHAGRSQEVDLATLPAFAFFQGHFGFPGQAPTVTTEQVHMYAFVNGNLCGREARGLWGGESFYYVTVYSAEQQSGCGAEGVDVTFELADLQDNILGVAREKGVWHAWGEGNVGQNLDLTMDPPSAIQLASLGDGSSQRDESLPWPALAAVLGLGGVLTIAGSIAIRRRAGD